MSAQIVVRIPEEQKTELELTAQRLNTTLSELIKQGIELVLKKIDKKKTMTLSDLGHFAQENAKDLDLSQYSTDLSTQIDRYLYGDLNPQFGDHHMVTKKPAKKS